MRTYSWKALKECQDQHQLASQQSQPHRTLPPGFVDCHRHVSLSCHRTRLQCAFQARCPGTFGQLGLQHGLLIQKHLANHWWPLTGSENGITMHNLGPMPMVYYHLGPSSSLWVCTPFSDTGLSNLGHSSIITVWLHFPYLLNHATSKLGSFFGFKFHTKIYETTPSYHGIFLDPPTFSHPKRIQKKGLPRSPRQPRPSDGTAVCREAQRYQPQQTMWATQDSAGWRTHWGIGQPRKNICLTAYYSTGAYWSFPR